MGVRINVTLQGGFAALGDQLAERVMRGEDLAAQRLLTLAVDRSPWDIGTLAGAHSVEPASDPDEGAALVVDTPYAARLHEHPEYNFSTDENPNAQGKWVENAAMENKTELGQIIAKTALDG
ncbi:hypothetical protein GCM10009775_04680 [Microbacterium aoyamense]|uniref:Minor capsid protein n=1 Tax=Microbacterium aoyamense TaxID=344166 RepID=A0ABN2PCG8_9MICO|nr:hypothetical protein [Microbacterium aoyamense]